MSVPADVVNRALDAIGCTNPISELEEGTREAKAALRVYEPTLKQLLRSANWNFARKTAVLTMLQDATGQTTQAQQSAGYPVTVGTGTVGMGVWVYEYQWPIDGVKARWVPWNNTQQSTGFPSGNISIGSQPTMTGIGSASAFVRQIPARFVVAQDNVPPFTGQPDAWTNLPDLMDVQGQGQGQQTVILTNVPSATLVYTALIPSPDAWDGLFAQAFVALLGAYLAMPCLDDKKFAIAMRGQQIAAAKEALSEARRVDGDEMWATTDHNPDWLRVRNSGPWGNGWGRGGNLPGVLGYGWDSCSFPDGSCY